MLAVQKSVKNVVMLEKVGHDWIILANLYACAFNANRWGNHVSHKQTDGNSRSRIKENKDNNLKDVLI